MRSHTFGIDASDELLSRETARTAAARANNNEAPCIFFKFEMNQQRMQPFRMQENPSKTLQRLPNG